MSTLGNEIITAIQGALEADNASNILLTKQDVVKNSNYIIWDNKFKWTTTN